MDKEMRVPICNLWHPIFAAIVRFNKAFSIIIGTHLLLLNASHVWDEFTASLIEICVSAFELIVEFQSE